MTLLDDLTTALREDYGEAELHLVATDLHAVICQKIASVAAASLREAAEEVRVEARFQADLIRRGEHLVAGSYVLARLGVLETILRDRAARLDAVLD